MEILQVLKLLTGLFSFIVIGYPFSYLLLVRSRLAASDAEAYIRYKIIYGSLLNIILSFFIGTLIATVYLNILSLLKISFSLKNIGIFSGIFFFISVFIFSRYKKKLLEAGKLSFGNIDNVYFLSFKRIRFFGEAKNLNPNTSKRLNFEQLSLEKPDFKTKLKRFKNAPAVRKVFKIVIILLIAVSFFTVLFFTFLFPIRFWDAISCWSLKAKAFFIDKNIFTFYTQHDYVFAHNSYPIYLPLVQTWLYIWLGEINDTLVKIIFPIFYFCSIFIIFNFFRKKSGEILSLILAFVFGSIPVIVDHGYIEYTNLLFSLVLFIAVYFLSTYLSNEIAEINEHTTKKREIIENIRHYFYERQTRMPFDFKIHNNLDAVFKEKPSNGSMTFNLSNKNVSGGFLNAGTYLDHLKLLSIDRYRKYSHLLISALFFSLLALIRSEGFIFSLVFILLCLAVYLFGLLRKLLIKKRFKKILIQFIDPDDDINFKEWKDKISARFIKNKERPFTVLKLLVKKLLLPLLFIISINFPWLLTKAILKLSLTSLEWQTVFKGKFTFLLFFEGIKRALSAFITEFVYSSYDSTRAFLGSSYGPVLLILLIILIAIGKKAFTNGGFVFFIFTVLVYTGSFISIIFVKEFEGSIERYIMPGFFLSFYWILSSAFKNRT